MTVGNVRFMQQYESNFLFRGGSPIGDDGSFDANGLADALAAAATEVGVTLPASYRIIDINLQQLENADEIPKVQTESAYFQNAPEAGEFHFWETSGTGVCAIGEGFSDAAFRDWLAVRLDDWMGDRLVERVETLNTWLRNSTKGPTVIYIHCQGGDDRTGELAAAYSMRFLDMSWQAVNEINQSYNGGTPFGCNNYRAALWYCIHLVATLGYNLDFETVFKCNDPAGPWAACTCSTPAYPTPAQEPTRPRA